MASPQSTLTPEQEAALHVLETTRTYADGEAALAVLNAVRRPAFDAVDVILAIAAGFYTAWISALLNWAQIPAAARLPVTLLGFALLFAAFILNRRAKSPVKRIAAAINRWRQISGTLAVQSHAGSSS
jgi:hypothetical protein